MVEGFKALTQGDILYAALMALVATQLILSLLRIFKVRVKVVNGAKGLQEIDRLAIIKKCMDMFPMDTIYFRGKVFSKGMKVRITTFQKKIIEGEIIGKNDMNILCIMVGQHIIAHEMEKIEDMIEMPSLIKENS